jgi:hypothetical protein
MHTLKEAANADQRGTENSKSTVYACSTHTELYKIHDLVPHAVLKCILVWCPVERVERQTYLFDNCRSLARKARLIMKNVVTTWPSLRAWSVDLLNCDAVPCRILTNWFPSSKCSVNFRWWVLIHGETAREIFTSSWQRTHWVTLHEMTSTRGFEELFVLPPIRTSEKRSRVVWLSINCFHFQKESSVYWRLHLLALRNAHPRYWSCCVCNVCCFHPTVQIRSVLAYHHISFLYSVLFKSLAELFKWPGY